MGIFKISCNDIQSLIVDNQILKSINAIKYFVFITQKYIPLFIHGYISRFKLVGVGYRQFYNDNLSVYKLRYSHLVYYSIPLNTLGFKKNKRKKLFSIFGLNRDVVNSTVNLWMSYRVCNVFTLKGFFKHNKYYNSKLFIKKRI